MFLLRRKTMPAVGLFAGLASAGYADQAGGHEEDRSFTVGYMNRDEDVTVSKILLEEEFDFALTEGQIGELEIQDAGEPEKGTRAWLEEHRDVGEAWLPKN
ncbi:MAG: hypothetical protein M3P37_06120 [Actinomycetota bacterium]|nr:hypothetical protein [Actinomycetota bacterium]